jgi:hypothetical protein
MHLFFKKYRKRNARITEHKNFIGEKKKNRGQKSGRGRASFVLSFLTERQGGGILFNLLLVAMALPLHFHETRTKALGGRCPPLNRGRDGGLCPPNWGGWHYPYISTKPERSHLGGGALP